MATLNKHHVELRYNTRTRDRVKEGRAVDALALGGEEGRDKRRNSTGRCKCPLIRGNPNGATRLLEWQASFNGGEPGELKHLSNRRKRKQQ